MQTNKELVSIILPVYNAGAFLADSLKSLLIQSYKNIEIVAIDDGSKDNSFQILKEFRKKDPRIRLFRNKKRYGLGICFNRGAQKAKGVFITFTSAIDLNVKDRIKKQVKALQENPKLAAIGTQCKFIDEKSKKIGQSLFPLESELIYQTLLTTTSLQFETVLIQKSLLPKDIFKFCGSSYPFTYSEVFIKLFQYGQFANLKEILYAKRDTASLYSKLKTKDQIISFLKVLLKSMALYDYRPSLPSLFGPQVKQI